MINFLEETLGALAQRGKRTEDARWVGRSDGPARCAWETFSAMARDFDYEPRGIRQKVDLRLVVVGDGWWLERFWEGYSEGWALREMPRETASPQPLARDEMLDEWGNLSLEERRAPRAREILE